MPSIPERALSVQTVTSAFSFVIARSLTLSEAKWKATTQSTQWVRLLRRDYVATRNDEPPRSS